MGREFGKSTFSSAARPRHYVIDRLKLAPHGLRANRPLLLIDIRRRAMSAGGELLDNVYPLQH